MAGFQGRDYDPIGPMILVSVILHLSALVGMALYAKYWTDHGGVKISPDNYVVHLINPGEAPGEEGIGKSAIVDAAPPPAPEVKTSENVEKKTIPIEKADAKELKKIPVVKKKQAESKKTVVKEVKPVEKVKVKSDAPKKEAEAVAKEIKIKKGGGSVDISKFPYEWYLKVTETRVFGNWDILQVNMSVTRDTKVVVLFYIKRNGTLGNVEIEQTSYDAAVDQSAMEAVYNSAPFPPLPDGYKEDTLPVHFGFSINKQR